MIADVWRVRWTIAFGVLCGVMAGPWGVSLWGAAQGVYDQVRPVVSMRGELLRRDAESVVVRLSGEKFRDCAYIRMTAFAESGELGTLNDDLYIRREDHPESGATKPPGRYTIGDWRIWPVRKDARSIDMYSQHDCGGRVVLTRVARVPL